MGKKMYKKGYTQGVFDMFHVGHLRLINNAKLQCIELIVGVNSDDLVQKYKSKLPVISESDRLEIISNIRNVDSCLVVDTLDKVELYKQIGFDAVFIGDDWKGNKRWVDTENELKKYGVDVIYLPYTTMVTSTNLRKEVGHRVNE